MGQRNGGYCHYGGGGHPACVMDMSFAMQALKAEYILKKQGALNPQVYDVPVEIEQQVCTLKLKTMSFAIDKLTAEQEKYLATISEGT